MPQQPIIDVYFNFQRSLIIMHLTFQSRYLVVWSM